MGEKTESTLPTHGSDLHNATMPHPIAAACSLTNFKNLLSQGSRPAPAAGAKPGLPCTTLIKAVRRPHADRTEGPAQRNFATKGNARVYCRSTSTSRPVAEMPRESSE